MTPPLVSIIVPCRNEAKFIERCLDSILQSDYPAERMEIIISDGMSDDGTRAIVAEYVQRDSRVRAIDNSHRTTPVALNRAIDEARGEVILRLDAHAEMAPDYVSRCVAYLESSGAHNVGGVRVERAQDEGLFAGAIVAAMSCRFGVGNAHYRFDVSEARPVDTVFGGCWRREIFERIGKFNPRLARSQDMEFNQRIRKSGGRILLIPGAVTYYYTRSRLGPFLRHNWNNGVWSVVPFAYSHVIPVRPRHLVPLGLVVVSAVLLVAAVFFPAWRWAPAGTLVPYATANLAASIQVAVRKKNALYLLLMPITFFGLHFPYGAGSLWGVFKVAVIRWRRNITTYGGRAPVAAGS